MNSNNQKFSKTKRKTIRYKRSQKAWYKEPEIASNLVTLPNHLIVIGEELHKSGITHVPLNCSFKNTVAVNALEDGTYKLIVGINSCIRAKLFDLPVEAYVTTDDRETFKEKYQLHK